MRLLNTYRLPRALLLGAVALTLGACSGNMDDLNEYIDTVKARPGQRPEKLPEIKPYETYVYRADETGVRSPFQPDSPTSTVGGNTGPRPDSSRPQEFLESEPLDSLSMVGTLSIDGRTYGLLQTTGGLIHRVLPGNYVGQNDGRIRSISNNEIQLVEIVSDGIGGYLEREAAISLSD